MNFTDVGHMVGEVDTGVALAEDKMALAAKREKKSVWDIADFYIKAALEDFKMMNFLEPEVRPRATEHIKEMIELVQRLIEKGYAYIVKGSVYYEVSKFKDYGKLSGNTIAALRAGAGGRVEFNPDKREQFDFALWVNDPQHVMRWDSPWSTGYPGWHLECSVMAMKYLGETIDIHTGGEDNIFPHHESEIAQSEAATGKPFVRYWVHLRHLLVNGQKMSKSLGNYYTLRDLIKLGYSARAFRYLLLSSHYRSHMNFTEEGLRKAEVTVSSLIDFLDRIREIKTTAPYNEKLHEKMLETKERFERHMDNDLGMPEALAAIFGLVTATNRAIDEGVASEQNLKEIYDLMMEFDKVLGILAHVKKPLPPEFLKLIEQREAARRAKDWATADHIRAQLAEKGIILEDLPVGTRWRWKK
jgi:cysteinyl-tRNA synthetase